MKKVAHLDNRRNAGNSAPSVVSIGGQRRGKTDRVVSDIPQSGQATGIVSTELKLAKLIDIESDGCVRVRFQEDDDCTVKVRSTVVFEPLDIGAEVVVWIQSDPSTMPIVVGKVQMPSRPKRENHVEIQLDGQEIQVVADRDIVLRCGSASIRLTRNGKIVLSGVAVVSKAKKTNRIVGATIELN